MTGARETIIREPGWNNLLEECIVLPPPPHNPPPPPPLPLQDDAAAAAAGREENPLPARPTHLSLTPGWRPPETRRPSAPKDERVFLLVSIVDEFCGRGVRGGWCARERR